MVDAGVVLGRADVVLGRAEGVKVLLRRASVAISVSRTICSIAYNVSSGVGKGEFRAVQGGGQWGWREGGESGQVRLEKEEQ